MLSLNKSVILYFYVILLNEHFVMIKFSKAIFFFNSKRIINCVFLVINLPYGTVIMNKILLALGCTLAISNIAYADNCEEVKAMIGEKIKANGVPAFTLEAIPKGTATDKKIVGVCGGGTKDVVYQRGNAAPSQATTETAQPAATQEAEKAPTATE